MSKGYRVFFIAFLFFMSFVVSGRNTFHASPLPEWIKFLIYGLWMFLFMGFVLYAFFSDEDKGPLLWRILQRKTLTFLDGKAIFTGWIAEWCCFLLVMLLLGVGGILFMIVNILLLDLPKEVFNQEMSDNWVLSLIAFFLLCVCHFVGGHVTARSAQNWKLTNALATGIWSRCSTGMVIVLIPAQRENFPDWFIYLVLAGPFSAWAGGLLRIWKGTRERQLKLTQQAT